jgi:HlyD family secretion protein
MKLKYYKKEIFFIIVFLIVGSFGVIKFLESKKVEYNIEQVKRGSLVRTVSVTGSIISDLTTDLHFEVNGRLDKISFSEGDSLKRGDIIAELEANDEKIQIQEAEASLVASRANLDLKKAGATLEDIRVTETSVMSAEVALKIAQTNLNNIKDSGEENIKRAELDLQNAEVSLDSANITLLNSEKSLENVIATNSQTVEDSYESLKVVMQKNLLKIFEYLAGMDEILGVDDEDANDEFQSSLGRLKSTTFEAAQQAYRDARSDYRIADEKYLELDGNDSKDLIKLVAEEMEWALYSLDNALLNTRILLNNSVVSKDLTEAAIATFKAAIDTDRIGNNSELTSLQTKKQALVSSEIAQKTNNDSAQASYDVNKGNYDKAFANKEIVSHSLESIKIETTNAIKNAELEIEAKSKSLETARASLDFKKAPPRQVDIASLEAQVVQAEASLSLAKKNLEKTILRAPTDGVIVNINGEIGENISVADKISVIISPQLIIEADISEADIDKIELNQITSITFDAFGEEEIFNGKIFFIDPTETKIQDVIYYKVKVSLEDRHGKSIRSGMTANLDILTAQNDNILFISQRSVIEKEGVKIVRILDGSEVKEVRVVTGIRGDGGVIEIVSGLQMGQQVVISIKEKK